MTKLYIIRHAEAEGNMYRRAQGHYNGQVTGLGRRQIDALAERFREIPIDAVYSSDLSRTIATAGAILKYHDLPLHTDPQLREVHMGWWEGVPWGNIQEAEPEQVSHFSQNPEKWIVEGNERFDQLTRRISEAIRTIACAHDGQTVAIVSHGMAIRAFLAYAMQIPSAEIMRIPHGDNTAVSLLEADGDALRVIFANDNSHLAGGDLSTFAKQTWWKNASGMELNNLSIHPLDAQREKALYISCYRDAWTEVHGGEEGFNGDIYWNSAARHLQAHPQAVVKAMRGGELAGLLDLDTSRGAGEGTGWISLCYMAPSCRGQHLAVQLIGHAVVLYRELGRRCIRLHVSADNTRAIGFYTRYGFKDLGTEQAGLRTMELQIQ